MATRRYEKVKVFDFNFKTKREAMLVQQSLRNKLFHSLSVYSFASYVYSRGGDSKNSLKIQCSHLNYVKA